MAHGRATLSDVSDRLSGVRRDPFNHTLATPKGLSLVRVEYKEEDLASAATDYYSLPIGPTPGLRTSRKSTFIIDW